MASRALFDVRVEHARLIADEDIKHFRYSNDPAAIAAMADEIEAKKAVFDEGPEMAVLVAAALRFEAARIMASQSIATIARG